MTYTHIWHGPTGDIPVTPQRFDDEKLVVRARDPYDPGEVEFKVDASEVSPPVLARTIDEGFQAILRGFFTPPRS